MKRGLIAVLLIALASVAWWSCRLLSDQGGPDPGVRRGGWSPGGHTRIAPSPRRPASAAELVDLITRQGSLTFRSWDGKWIGTDIDTDVTFLPGGAVHVIHYGVAVSGWRGTYRADSNGDVTLNLPAAAGAWPPLSLRLDATSLLLTPKPGEEGPSWPFRPLSATDEAWVRQRIDELGQRGED